MWNGVMLAESDKIIVVEGNHYFLPGSVNRAYLQETSAQTTCPWKGQAGYYDVKVNGDVNRSAACYYRNPKPAATQIRDYVAFWRGARVEP